MSTIFAVIAIFAIYVLVSIIPKTKKPRFKAMVEKPPYFAKKSLLHEGEQNIFRKLIEALPNSDYSVFPQIGLSEIVNVGRSENRQAWLNKINQKSVDFVICNKSFTVRLCIEFDGKTHEREDRKKADTDKDEALETAGIPIWRIKSDSVPNMEDMKITLEQFLLH